ncbi:MAG: bifunctional UDP-N-acetylglucosamine diphosphorylase/glucosamine-1-phosphate N-acetyltransferase GlmU [Actinobacteria bacterium]|nr:bifunctional UDP-N-acetylglucosamine diphosphorylase/glucosamine-1-phosphate N-acetyltransferase GlmU [Actinomycetota bacterium]
MTRPALAIVLAAGEGTRMKSSLVKVLHPVAGRPVLGHVLHSVAHTEPQAVVVVVGHQSERVTEYVTTHEPGTLITVQAEQRGTGHAVRVCLEQLAAQGHDPALLDGPVLVLAGDAPLVRGTTLEALLDQHVARGAAATVLSAHLDDPTGYGRIVRDASGDVASIVEHRDATVEQLRITEVNSGTYVFDSSLLISALGRITTDNAQGEEYLTDVLGIARSDGAVVSAYAVEEAEEILGINDRVQLAECARVMRDRINVGWMRAGVTIVDPASTWIDVDAEIGRDSILQPSTILLGPTLIAENAVVGPDTTLVACEVGAGATVLRSHCEYAVIGEGANVGPFTYLRANARLGEGAKAGAYVEIKNSQIGRGSKVPHLSYVGDAEVGEGTNIGAATVFVNYDGVNKHRTVVGNHVRVGSDTMLVAPVTIGDGAYTAAGSVITEDVPAGAMAVGRARQRNVDGWVERKRSGSPAADASERARQDHPEQSTPEGES